MDKINLNPLTGLPANQKIKEKLTNSIGDPSILVVYIDITDFKPYNEVYGFTAGDNVILSLAELLNTVCRKVCKDDYFLGHIGGDDFLVTINAGYLKKLFKYLDDEFLKIRKSFYQQADISRGSIIAWSREGQRVFFPLMGICGVAFSPYTQKFNTAEQVAEFATHLKESSKHRRLKDNVFITPDNINILPVPLKEFILDKNIPLYQRRTVIEAMGESGLLHYGKVLLEVADKEIDLMLKKSLIYSLGRLRYNPCEKLLLKFLSYDNPHIRTRSVEAISNIGGSKHLKVIGEKLCDSNPYVAVMAAKSLANMGHPEGIKFLRKIPQDSTRWLKMEAIISRCILQDLKAVNDCKDMLNDSNAAFRRKAAKALELIPSPEGVRILCESVKKEKNSSVKRQLIVSAGRMAEKLNSQDVKKISTHLWHLFKNADKNLKIFILPSLGKTGLKKAKKVIEKYLNSKSKWERYRAIEGITYFPGSIKVLQEKLDDFSPQVRARSARSLGEVRSIESMELLRKRLKDTDNIVRRSASDAILKMAAGCGAMKERTLA